MSTDRGKSFIASVWVEGVPVSFSKVEDSHGTPRNKEWKYMCANSHADEPAQIYFRYRHDHYVLFFRGGGAAGAGCIGSVRETSGTTLGGASTHDFLCGGEPDDDSMYVYLLNSAGEHVTLDHLSQDEVKVGMHFHFPKTFAKTTYSLCLKEKKNVLSQWWAHLVAVGAGIVPSNPIFTLKILERNAAYLSQPNEV
ncbi:MULTISPECIES: hypothetical protein [Pseudomonas]|uniref:Uncharacterized protein n=1 Tax=Pseudomonas synxantha TaxID=47883 RepID=A0A5D3G656_9PSED|nr:MULTISPECIES: hypothetical protein [Pseudomonas]MCK3824958.1 hypothetical protein [Pseudomonas sp. W2Aug9]MCK3830854.1 hypothetical protein [Pseudomonas fluorescens]TYK55590.1 hypothetical protein FXO26_22920 [Pseudomonas synxantha]